MGLIVFLLIIFLFMLWGRVTDLKKEYDERVEHLEFTAQLLKDRLSVLKKIVEKTSPSKQQSKVVPSEKTSEADLPIEAAKEAPVSDIDKNAEKLEKTELQPSTDQSEGIPTLDSSTSSEAGDSRLKEINPFDISNVPATEKEADDLKIAAEKVAKQETTEETQVLSEESSEPSIEEELKGSGDGKSPPPPPPPPIGPTWGESWQNFVANVDWEQFTGTKLFAWLGGIALFLGAGFFVKYSIDKNLISPMLRLVIGAVVGLIMIGGSFWFERGRYDVMRQTFSAGGIGVLYSVFFAATLYYEYLPKTIGFATLVVVSATAFVLAIFHRGVSISVLGAIGAYLTPLLVNTGQGNILTLFLYLAIVNLGLYQVIKRLQSNGLLIFSTIGTMVSLLIASVYSKPEPEAMYVAWAWLGHLALYSAFFDKLKPDYSSRAVTWAVITTYLAMPAVALLLVITKSGSAPMLLLAGSVSIAMALAFRVNILHSHAIPFTVLTFCVTVIWTFLRFTPDIDNYAFILFFIYGLAGGAGPIILIYRNGLNDEYLKWFRVFPVAVAMLGLMTLIINPNVSFLFWPMTIGLQLVGIAVSLVFGAILQVGILALILLISGLLFITNSAFLTFNLTFYGFILLAGVAICLVTFFILRRLVDITERLNIDPEVTKPMRLRPVLTEWMSASPVMGIFFILAAAFMRGEPLNPHPGMVTMLCFLTIALTLTKRMKFEYLAILSLFSAAFSQAFFVLRPNLTMALNFSALIWSGLFFVASMALPFIFFKSYEQWKKMWMSWAIYEVVQAIFFIYAADHIWARDYSGWIPLLMAIGKTPIVMILLKNLEGKAERNSIIACHGGVMLFYVSAVPILLLETGWLGLVLVLEAAALLWLNRRVEHSGLRVVSSALAPVGLYLLLSYMPQLKGPESIIILNPAVLSTLAAVLALAYSVKLADYPSEKLGQYNLVKYFQWLAFITGFYLINLVVADVFAGSKVASGATLQFLPREGILQEIAYTTLWALFGAILWRSEKLPTLMRYLGMALLAVSTFWLILFPFLHGNEVAAMGPVFNLGLLAYLPILLILIYVFLKEPWGTRYLSIKNLFLGMLLVVGFLTIKLVKATIFQAGLPLDLFRERTAQMAVASAGGWIIYGLAMLLWPKRLDKPFRVAGLVLAVLGLIRSLLFPFKYAADFGAMTPLFNRPTLLYLFVVGVLLWLVTRKPAETWPIASIPQKTFWGSSLAIMAFLIMNIEIASYFGAAGQPFSLLAHGNLSHQLGYSLGWLIYAVSMLVVGIKWQVVRARQAALLLIIITSLKIFLKDLWSLGQLYRVASFIGLAVIMMLVSYLYQRFLTKMGDK